MGETWAVCPECRDVRNDVARRGQRVGVVRCCGDCARLHARTRSAAAYRERIGAPQEGGRDPLAELEAELAADFEQRARRRAEEFQPSPRSFR
jgi:hypothetical protein